MDIPCAAQFLLTATFNRGLSVQLVYGLGNIGIGFEEGEGDLSCKRLLREETELQSG
jgi:hypothetical protein